ncbi:MAG: hypothetical protein ACLR9W_09295 [Enterobacter hormaechei]
MDTIRVICRSDDSGLFSPLLLNGEAQPGRSNVLFAEPRTPT